MNIPTLQLVVHLLTLFDHYYLTLNTRRKVGKITEVTSGPGNSSSTEIVTNRLIQAVTMQYFVKDSQHFYSFHKQLSHTTVKYWHSSVLTWSGMTIMKIFLSLSDRMCLMKAQPVPIRAIVMNRRAPFSLKQKKILQRETLFYHTTTSAQVLSYSQ